MFKWFWNIHQYPDQSTQRSTKLPPRTWKHGGALAISSNFMREYSSSTSSFVSGLTVVVSRVIFPIFFSVVALFGENAAWLTVKLAFVGLNNKNGKFRVINLWCQTFNRSETFNRWWMFDPPLFFRRIVIKNLETVFPTRVWIEVKQPMASWWFTEPRRSSKQPAQHHKVERWKKNLCASFQFMGWLIGILLLAHCKPYNGEVVKSTFSHASSKKHGVVPFSSQVR